MHSFAKIAGVRRIGVALAMLLSVFGTQSLKAQDVVQGQGKCMTRQVTSRKAAHARHEAAEAHVRAERAEKRADENAAKKRAEADRIEKEGAQEAAKYEGKSNKILEDAGLLRPADETQSATVTDSQSKESDSGKTR